MNYFKIFLGIFALLAFSRFIPHPPNFTSLLTLSFYIPALLGKRFLPALIISFAITDVFIGFHSTVLFTWGSIILIGLMSEYFKNTIKSRLVGALLGSFIFFLITNFGVWSLGTYGLNFKGIVLCYTLAIPFFVNSFISTFIFSIIIEAIYKFSQLKNFLRKINI